MTDPAEALEETAALLEDVVCVDCDDFVDVRLELPGGTIVERDDVPFGPTVRGVDLVGYCPDCRRVVSRAR